MTTTLRMTRGDDKTFNMAFTKNSQPQNITGFSIWVTAKRAASDADATAVFQRTIGSGVTVTNAVGGLANFTVIQAHTSGFEASRVTLLCDVQLKDTPGNVVTAGHFLLLVDPDITRAV